MLTDHRKQLLLARLSAEGQIIASAIAAELGISEDTIRRDLRELAAEGRLTRVHGGALPASPAIAPLDQRRSIATPEKIRLAHAALPLIQPGQTIFIDGGTTHAELIRAFPATLSATIVTHSPTIAAELEPFRQVEVILIGGRLFRHSMVAVGTDAADAIRRLRFDAGEMTQKDLADRIGVTRQTVLAIENGKYFPTLELAFRIARTFGVGLDEVFTFHDD